MYSELKDGKVNIRDLVQYNTFTKIIPRVSFKESLTSKMYYLFAIFLFKWILTWHILDILYAKQDSNYCKIVIIAELAEKYFVATRLSS